MYEFTSLFLYKTLFAAELFVAETLMSLNLKRKKFFPLRLAGSLFAVLLFAFALPVLSYGVVWNITMFLAIFFFSLFSMSFTYDEPWRIIVFCGIAGYVTQHVAYEVFDMASVALSLGPSVDSGAYSDSLFDISKFFYGSGAGSAANPFMFVLYGYVYGMTYFFSYLFMKSKKDKIKLLTADSFATVVLVALILLFAVALSSVVTAKSKLVYEKGYLILLAAYNICCCMLAMYLQFDVALRRKLETDVTTIKSLWEKDKAQYELSKANIEAINLKFHDLKYRIRRIGSLKTVDDKTIGEIERAVSFYDAAVKTGNPALDVILTEKSLLSYSDGIKFCCIADGKALSFMEETDLYTLFGNLADNAIEAVRTLEADKKVISLSVKRANDFLSVNMHNCYEGELRFKDTLPLTTKKDSESHGYGMKSVKLLCEKYGGELSVSTDKNVFNVNIVFPLS